MKQWYVVETGGAGQTILGPLDEAQLRDLAAQGRLRPEMQACPVGATAWARVGDFPELMAFLGVQPAAAPAPAIAAQPVVEEPRAWDWSASAGSAPAPATEKALPPFSFGNAFSWSFELLREHYGKLLLVALVYLLLQSAMQIAGIPFNMAMETVTDHGDFRPVMAPLFFGGLILAVASIVIGIPLAAGIQWAGVRAARKELDVSDLFAPYKRFFTVLGVALLSGLLQLALALPLVIAAALAFGAAIVDKESLDRPMNAAVAGVLLLVAFVTLGAMLYLATRLYFASVLVLDPRATPEGAAPLGAVEALKHSWELTAGRTLELLAYGICAVLVVMATILIFCVGLFFVGFPLLIVFYGSAYELLRRSPRAS